MIYVQNYFHRAFIYLKIRGIMHVMAKYARWDEQKLQPWCKIIIFPWCKLSYVQCYFYRAFIYKK